MNDIRKTAACALALCVLLSAVFLSGCAWIGSALETMGGAEATERAGSSRPGNRPAETEPAEPKEQAPPNPVFLLCTDYLSALEAACGGIIEAAAECGDADAVRAYMRLCGCEAELALLYSAVGLMSSDGGGWSGSFTGPFAGSGSMSSRGVFEYVFEDGRVMAGRAGADMAEYGVGPGEAPFDPTEPTPGPTPETTQESGGEAVSAGPTEAPTEAGSEEPTAELLPTEAGASRFDPPDWRELARSMSGDTEYAALLRTQAGFIGVVLNAGGLSILEISGGELYFAPDAGAAVLAGLDPFTGIAGLSEPVCDILRYSNGVLTLTAA